MMKINKGTFIFQTALAIYLATTIFDLSMFGYMTLFSMVSKALRYIAYLLLIWKLIDDSYYNPNQLIKFGLGIVIALISYRVTGEKLLFFTLLFLMAVTNVYFDDVMRVALWTNGICMLIIMASYKLGLVPDRLTVGGRSRYSLGFIFPSIGSNFWLYFVLIYIAYRREKLKITEGVILEGIAYYFFIRTDTRSAFAISTIAIFLTYVLKVWKEQKGRYLFSFLIKYITFIGTLSFSLLVFFSDKVSFISTTMDKLLSNRISLTHSAIQMYGVRLFGQPIEWVGGMLEYNAMGQTYNYVDSSYMQIMLNYGFIILLILLVAYSMVGREIVQKRAWYLGLVMMLGAVHNTFDPQFLLFQYNIFFLTIGYLLTATKAERRKYLFGCLREEIENEQ